MCRVKKILIVCLCTVSSFVFALHSSPSYAEGFSQSGYYGWQTSYLYYGLSASQQTGWVTSQHDGYGMYFGGPNGTIGRFDADIYGDVPANSIISFNVSVCADNGVSWAGFSGSAQWFLIDHATTAQDGSCFTEHYRFYNTTVQTTIALTGANGFIGSGNFHRIDFTGISWATLASGTNYSSDLGQLRTELNNLNTNSVIINDNISNVVSGVEDLRDAQNQANQDANDRYEDEKDTINDNGDNANSSWTDNADNLKFQPPTFLFNWFWSLGTTDQCIDISTFASLIHSNETQYCSWYPNNIRSIISPIINIFLVCFISGFIIKWLKKDGI